MEGEGYRTHAQREQIPSIYLPFHQYLATHLPEPTSATAQGISSQSIPSPPPRVHPRTVLLDLIVLRSSLSGPPDLAHRTAVALSIMITFSGHIKSQSRGSSVDPESTKDRYETAPIARVQGLDSAIGSSGVNSRLNHSKAAT